MSRSIIYSILSPLFNSRINEVNGLENLPTKGPFLIVSNHVSYLDPPLIAALVFKANKEKVFFITQGYIFRFFGNILGRRIFGMIPVNESSKAECLDTMLALLKEGKVVVVFPEGGRGPKDVLGKGKTGAARLALWTKCPVVPIGYQGPRHRRTLGAIGLFFLRNGKIKINIGNPLDLARFYGQPITTELLEEVTKTIMLTISNLCEKKYPY